MSNAEKKPLKALATALTLPTVMTAGATGVASAVLNFVQQSAQNAASSVSDGLTSRRTTMIEGYAGTLERGRPLAGAIDPSRVSSDVPISGPEYFFGPSWKSYADQSKVSAEIMAYNVVRIARELAGTQLSTGDTHRYVQWVLAGSIDPTRAADILAGDDNEKAKADLEYLAKLIRSQSEGGILAKWQAQKAEPNTSHSGPSTVHAAHKKHLPGETQSQQ